MEIFGLKTIIPLEAQTLFLTDMVVDSQGRFAITDMCGKQFLIFNQDGKLIKTIGKAGVKPGEFQLPNAITKDEKGNFYITDHAVRRLSAFSPDGKLTNSFIFTEYHTQPFTIRVAKELLFAGASNPATNTYVQVLSLRGEFLYSFCPKSATSIDFDILGVFFDLYKDSLFVVQIGDYRIWEYGLDGKLVRTFGEEPKYFVPPKMKHPGNCMEGKYEKWAHSWTQVIKICASPKDKLIFLQLNMNDLVEEIKEKYVIDVWTIDGKFVDNFKTNDKLLCADENGFVYFLREEKAKDLQKFFIVKYRRNI
ncbi:MAG: 6-bladed beta-propeller [bacterium]|nr:6-bladed beta-propeller [bacterium]